MCSELGANRVISCLSWGFSLAHAGADGRDGGTGWRSTTLKPGCSLGGRPRPTCDLWLDEGTSTPNPTKAPLHASPTPKAPASQKQQPVQDGKAEEIQGTKQQSRAQSRCV
jgi:hypothetical protein